MVMSRHSLRRHRSQVDTETARRLLTRRAGPSDTCNHG